MSGRVKPKVKLVNLVTHAVGDFEEVEGPSDPTAYKANYAKEHNIAPDTLTFRVVKDEDQDDSDIAALRKVGRKLTRTEVIDSTYLLVAIGERIATPAPASGAGGATAAAPASTSGRGETSFEALVMRMDALEIRARRAEWASLFIPPTHSVASSGDARSPPSSQRSLLKDQTIDYYGLWAPPATEGGARRVYTMLPASDDEVGHPVAVPREEAILAHIWPSKMQNVVPRIAATLGLQEDFHVRPRNYLVLRKSEEEAFDKDALVLCPTSGPPVSAVARLLHAERILDPDDQVHVRACAGRRLYLPRAGEGHIPSMRLLGWKALSALHADATADDGMTIEHVPEEVELDVSDDGGSLRRAAGQLAEARIRYHPFPR